MSALADDYRRLRMEVKQLRHRVAIKEATERRQRMFGAPGAGSSKFKGTMKKVTARSYLAQFTPVQPAPPETQPAPPAPENEAIEEDGTTSVADPTYSPTHPLNID